MVRCPKCAEAQQPRLTCAKCGTPLGAELDAFAAFGLSRKLWIDLVSLEQRYHELGRKVHPDRFAGESAGVRIASLKSTANLTRAYRALRDPVNRGLYWLELHGRKLSEANQSVPAELAATVFELQEQLSDLRAAADSGEAARLRRDIEEQQGRVQAAISETLEELNANFKAWDVDARDQRGEADEALFVRLKRTLARIAYLRTLLRDIGKTLEVARTPETGDLNAE